MRRMSLKLHTTFEKHSMEFVLLKKKRIAIPLIWLLIYLTILPMQLSDYVLCIGTDGHVALEISTNGRCTDAHAFDSCHAAPMITGAAMEDNHCGACIDLTIFVPLNTEPYLVPANDVPIHPNVSSLALETCQKSSATILISTPCQNISSFVDPILISLRTTTLLI